MTKRVLALMLALSMSVGIVLSGCNNSGGTSSAGGNTASEDTTSGGKTDDSGSSVKAFEDIEFPDEVPKKIAMGDDLDYSYDDMTEHYEIEIISTNYYREALPAEKIP